jgi:hypothetical protein
MKKDIKNLHRKLEAQGWMLKPTRNGHVMAFPPDKSKSPVTMPSTPSDHRSLKNTLADLRRSGFQDR